MKEIVQQTGKRPYTGDDFLLIQDEAKSIWEGLFGAFGDFIISGLDIIDNGDGTYNVSSGLVMLDGKIRRFYGAQNVGLPIYLVATDQTTNRQYFDGSSKPAYIEYKADYQTSQPIGVNYLTINVTGNRTWRDAIQDSAYRMVTDAMINAWNSHIANANNPHAVTPEQIGAAKTDLTNVSDTTILNKIKKVDGAGSGLDADKIDGYDSISLITIFRARVEFMTVGWWQIFKYPKTWKKGRGIINFYLYQYSSSLKTHILSYNGINLVVLKNYGELPLGKIRKRYDDDYIYYDLYIQADIKALQFNLLYSYYINYEQNVVYDIKADPDTSSTTIEKEVDLYNLTLGGKTILSEASSASNSFLWYNPSTGELFANTSAGWKKIALVDVSNQTGTIHATDFKLS